MALGLLAAARSKRRRDIRRPAASPQQEKRLDEAHRHHRARARRSRWPRRPPRNMDRRPRTAAPQPASSPQHAAQQPANERQLKPSSKALKAIVELQTAVNANDFANIPAKVAAAQAVATTKEDRYLDRPAAAQGGAGGQGQCGDWRRRSMRSPRRAISTPAKVGAALHGARRHALQRQAISTRPRRRSRRRSTLDPNNAEALTLLGRSAHSRRAARPRRVGRSPARDPAQRAGGPEAGRGRSYKRAVGVAYEAKLADRGRARAAVGRRLSERRTAGAMRSPSTATSTTPTSRARSTCCG